MTAHDDEGQATVEFALVLPLVVMVLALLVHLASISAAQLHIVEQTRVATRAASLAEDPRAAATAAVQEAEFSVEVWFDDEIVTVSVSRILRTEVPIIARFLPAVEVRSSLTMAREPVTR